MRRATMGTATMTSRRALQAACSAVAITSCGVICASSAGSVGHIAGLSLVGAFACAMWLIHRQRAEAIVPAISLTLVFLILAGLALAALHALSTTSVALALGIVALAAVAFPSPGLAEQRTWPKPPNPLIVTGVLIFAGAAVLAVRYSAASATADADAASSVALWAYPSGDQLHVGVQEPAGQSTQSLRIVVTQAGVTVATWNDIHLTPGQTWQAPALTVTGNGPAQVVALHGGTVVASLSSR